MRVIVNIQLKKEILDPQGKAVHHALQSLGFNDVEKVRIGKQIVLDIKENDKTKAMAEVEKMCEMLLANTIIETYEIEPI